MIKKLAVLLMVLSFFYACQDEGRKQMTSEPEAEEVPDSIQVLTGQFIYVADAAVLRGEDFVYGVTIDSMSQVLSERVKPLKKEDFDMVPVTVKAWIRPNPEQEGWEETIEIQEIIEVKGDSISQNKIEN
ncbi:hypothetical protein [Salegentibacter chungangensis]|uniref:NlpE C-terminal OB domain-containing protein n=1 Tax=Salegentibacter chungangensis TaxID=1335724 RepID=A0ABW3NPL0_9FLAO